MINLLWGKSYPDVSMKRLPNHHYRQLLLVNVLDTKKQYIRFLPFFWTCFKKEIFAGIILLKNTKRARNKQ